MLEDLTVDLGPIARGQLLDTVADLRRSLVPTVVVTDPDVAFVATLADRLAVVHDGRVVELGPTASVVDGPRHPYAQRLFEALPVPRPRSEAVGEHPGEVR